MKNLFALFLVIGSLALSDCTTTVEQPAPRTTSTTTEEHTVVRHPMGATSTTTTQVSPY